MALTLDEMLDMQRELWERHRDTWSPMEPEYGRNFLLWMVEEMSDVLMYYGDTLLRYGVTAEELSEAYRRKHVVDMGRDYEARYAEILSDRAGGRSAHL